MATINLLPRKAFEIILDSGEIIPGQYTTYALKRYCDKRKLKLSNLADAVEASSSTIDEVCDFVLCAVEHSLREAKKPFTYTDFDVCNWIDELGGIGSEGFASLVGHSQSETVEEKKSEATV